MSMNIKKGDTIVVLSGKDRGKKGKVLGTVPSDSKVVVEGINIATCHGDHYRYTGKCNLLGLLRRTWFPRQQEVHSLCGADRSGDRGA